jgi:ubiquinone/menaquinone biosynthesis C-methylase UbiE
MAKPLFYFTMCWIARFTAWFLNHLYRRLAWGYDFVAWTVSLGRWRDWGKAVLPFLSGNRMLELGHGPGHLQAELSRAGFQAIGLDASPQMGRLAAKNLRRSGFPSSLINGYAQKIPIANESFDCAAATFPTEYIFDPQTLREVWRVLCPQGKLVVVLSAWPGSASLPDRAAAWLFRITHQPGDLPESLWERAQARLTECGFTARLEAMEVRHSTVLILIAQKTALE